MEKKYSSVDTYANHKAQKISSLSYVSYSRQIIDFSKRTSENGELHASVRIADRNLSMRVRNSIGDITYGTITGVSQSGLIKIPLSNFPTEGVDFLRIEVKKDSSFGIDPSVGGIVLYHGVF